MADKVKKYKQADPAPAGDQPPPPSAVPAFAQPVYTPDPTQFVVPHPSDNAACQVIDSLGRQHKIRPLPFPAARGKAEPVLSLAQTLGGNGAAVEAATLASGQTVFHSVGNTGNVKSTGPRDAVSDKMMCDFDDPQARDTLQFFFRRGDVIYNFGEAQYYYDQFYDPYRNTPVPSWRSPTTMTAWWHPIPMQ